MLEASGGRSYWKQSLRVCISVTKFQSRVAVFDFAILSFHKLKLISVEK